jgi:hypothetical protein
MSVLLALIFVLLNVRVFLLALIFVLLNVRVLKIVFWVD